MADSTVTTHPDAGSSIQALRAGALDLPTERQAIHLALVLLRDAISGAISSMRGSLVDEVPEPACSALQCALRRVDAMRASPPADYKAFEDEALEVQAVAQLAADAVRHIDEGWARIAVSAAEQICMLACMPEKLEYPPSEPRPQASN